MAKVKMICPFSGKLCMECALYRGRHYFLCFDKQYRGYLKESGEIPKVKANVNFRVGTKDLCNLQALGNANPIDPFTVNMPDVK